MSEPHPANPDIHDILLQAAQADGPVRLFKPRGRPAAEGLCPGQPGSASAASPVLGLLGTCLRELPRAPGQPRLVSLTPMGLRTLVESTPPGGRPALLRQISPLYRDRLLRMWKDLAAPAERSALQASVAEHFGDLFGSRSDPPPAESAAAAFLRSMAKELVLSWERLAEPEARRGLARAMLSLGLRELGQPGERTRFTGRLHLSAEPLFQGDPVEIVEPGWTVSDRQGEFLLRKAQVRSLPPHA